MLVQVQKQPPYLFVQEILDRDLQTFASPPTSRLTHLSSLPRHLVSALDRHHVLGLQLKEVNGIL
jgi:hypothetical protein